MELPIASGVSPAPAASSACANYLERLAVPLEAQEQLTRASDGVEPDAVDAMTRVHRAIAGDTADTDNPAYGSIRRRLELAYGARSGDAAPTITGDARRAVQLVSTPALNRTPMAPRLWPPTLLFQLLRAARNPSPRRGQQIEPRRGCSESPDPRGRWHWVGSLRRIALG